MPNKAKSESNILKLIIDFYDSLPCNIISVHQYNRKAYHEGDLVDIINDSEFETKYQNSKTPGYWNFNKDIMGSVDRQIGPMTKSGWWPSTMEPYFGKIEDCGDFTNGKKACSQYVVSRNRIHSLPREFYLNMYTWLIENSIDEKTSGYHPVHLHRVHVDTNFDVKSSYYTSRYLEWTWELIFTSYKSWEKIRVIVNLNSTKPLKIQAIYGAKNYYRNVTSHLIQHFKKNNIIYIPKSISFNAIFGDTLANTVKTLWLTIDKQEYEIAENRDVDFSFELLSPISSDIEDDSEDTESTETKSNYNDEENIGSDDEN